MQSILDKIYKQIKRILPDRLALSVSRFFTVEFITFLIIGVINTLSTAVISTLLDYIAAKTFSSSAIIENLRLTFIIGYILSMLLSFILNCRFTFKEKPTFGKLIRFPISYIPNFIIQYITVWLFTSVLEMPKTAAYLTAAVIGIPITFLTMRIFVFKRK